ncbi:isochorismate synthase, chloroplastic-like [Andrographis paniculata]|uniref:isochorismate synthase, chloroplastic-like n=1 Tax=Andrographis paniculata TaxID=175694 RepID=UPI0021E807D6|nr:isochorismate synthase, chloroplastic-like [Andrographis paniculata]
MAAAAANCCIIRFLHNNNKNNNNNNNNKGLLYSIKFRCSSSSSSSAAAAAASVAMKNGELVMEGGNGSAGTTETRTFPMAATPALAADCLHSVVLDLKSSPSHFQSGIIRIQVPIRQHIESLDWLRSQNDTVLPRCYFSGREPSNIPLKHCSGENEITERRKLVSVAGLGSAVSFRHLRPFSLQDWHSIKRFLSKNSPLIRAYGAIRFDGTSTISPEWKGFGSFYFMIPQVEFDEFEGSSMMAATIAWDNHLLHTYEQAIGVLEDTLLQISSVVRKKLNGKTSTDAVLVNQIHVPNRVSWDSAIRNALELITRKDTPLLKVVLARSSRVLTTAEIDPLEWLRSLKAEGDKAYQFCFQPPDSAAFIGNTPERLFHRDELSVSSEALAATRRRGATEALDLKIGYDLLTSKKDHLEFTVVRENIRRKFEEICSRTIVEPSKSLRKLPRVQHLYAKLTGTLKQEDDEFRVLSSLHPTPAVCGLPAEDARQLIADTEMFDRGMYAGPVGYFGGSESEFAVGIRSALVGKDIGALLYAGTGIVEGSDSSMEWRELELKTSQYTKLMKHLTPAPVSAVNKKGL